MSSDPAGRPARGPRDGPGTAAPLPPTVHGPAPRVTVADAETDPPGEVYLGHVARLDADLREYVPDGGGPSASDERSAYHYGHEHDDHDHDHNHEHDEI